MYNHGECLKFEKKNNLDYLTILISIKRVMIWYKVMKLDCLTNNKLNPIFS